MSGKIPRQFIDDLLVRVDIVELIDSHVPLKKNGASYVARCPFHTEKSPSFSVSRQRQLYHCFGCGASGDAISFLMNFNHLEFIEAVEDLAVYAGVPLPKETGELSTDPQVVRQDLSVYYQLLEGVAGFYAEQLRSSEGKQAVTYLQQRGLTGEVARDFMLGYAPNSWDALLTQFDRKLLIEAGMLVVRDDGKAYDRFRGRLMFPIKDKRKRVIGFGGRVLDDSQPKYLNSPETPIFSKSREVYGLAELLEKHSRPTFILVVEGYMDVIALAQFGINQAVAALGTAMSKAHIDLLFRFSPELVLCFDGDKAGRLAAWRATEAALPALREGRRMRIMLLPQGHDPDSLVRAQGVDGFNQQIASAAALSDYFFQYLREDLNLATMEGRAQLLAMAKPQIEKIPQGFFRDLMFNHLRDLTGSRLRDKSIKPATLVSKPAGRVIGHKTPQSNLMRKILSLLLLYPHLAKQAGSHDWLLANLDVAGGELFKAVLTVINQRQPENSALLLEYFRETPHYKTLMALANLSWDAPDGSELGEFSGALTQLSRLIKEQRMSALIAKVERGEALTEAELLEYKSGGKF